MGMAISSGVIVYVNLAPNAFKLLIYLYNLLFNLVLVSSLFSLVLVSTLSYFSSPFKAITMLGFY